MKAWWKIRAKPRGMWRPMLEWGVHISAPTGAEMENLNCHTSIRYCLRGGVDPHPPCRNEERGERIMAFFPGVRLYLESARGHAESSDGLLGSYGACGNACPGRGGYDDRNTWYSYGEHSRGNVLKWQVRLPWRPGARPDYSDLIDPVREFLRRVLEELERRLAEARESAPSDKWFLEEEFDSFSMRQTENGVDVAERKLRVIRR